MTTCSLVQPNWTLSSVPGVCCTPSQVEGLWYQVRKKVGDIAPTLPQGVQGPYFNDEFGDVFGIVYAFTGDGFSVPQLRHVVEDVRESLLGVPGVGKVTLIGDQEERLYIDFSHRKLAELGLTVADILNVVARENAVQAAGFADTPTSTVTTPLGRSDLAVTGVTDSAATTTPSSTQTYVISYSNPGRSTTGQGGTLTGVATPPARGRRRRAGRRSAAAPRCARRSPIASLRRGA